MNLLITFVLCLNSVIAAPSELSNAIDQTDDVKVLHIAAKKGDHLTVSKLIKSGTSVDSTSEDGGTALHIAAEKGKEKVAQVLLSHGANVNSQDFAGETPLHRSVSNGHSNIVNLLIDNNANVNTASNDGSTALHLAYNSDKMKIAQKLIQHGADLTSENKNGESVVGLALNHVVKGLSTIFYGVKEIVHKGMKILKNPTEAIKQSNLHTIQLNIQHLPTVEMQFGKKTNNDPSDRSDQSDQSDDRIRSKSNGDFSPQPTLRFNFLH